MTNPIEGLNFTQHPENLLVAASNASGGAVIYSALFAFFMIIFLGGYYASKRDFSGGELRIPYVIASTLTMGLATLFKFVPDLIFENYIWGICLAFWVIGLLWLFFGRSD